MNTVELMHRDAYRDCRLERKRRLRCALLVCAAATVWALLRLPVTMHYGVDFHVSTRPIPLYAKAIAFVHRHIEYGLLADEITRGLPGESDRARAVFAWTRANIRSRPTELPVLDDHVLHIIIRGYGENDQMADVFTTLCAYAGMPAFWREGPIVLSFVCVEKRWAVFDLANGLMFTDPSGAFIDAETLLQHPELFHPVVGSLTLEGLPYSQSLAKLAPFAVPRVLRAQLHKPLPRLLFEMRHGRS